MMRGAAFAAFLAMAMVGPAQTATVKPQQGKPQKGDLTAELTEQERQMWETFGNKDQKGFAALLSDSFVYVTGDGYMNGPDLVKLILHCNQSSYRFKEVHVLPAGKDSAVVLAHVTSPTVCDGEVEPSELYAATTWVKQAGKWKVVVHSESEVPETKPATTPAPK
jgi:hypothetical protein